jgi:hypothetical protein
MCVLPIREGDAGPSYPLLDGVGDEDLAGLGYPRDADACECCFTTLPSNFFEAKRSRSVA